MEVWGGEQREGRQKRGGDAREKDSLLLGVCAPRYLCVRAQRVLASLAPDQGRKCARIRLQVSPETPAPDAAPTSHPQSPPFVTRVPLLPLVTIGALPSGGGNIKRLN